MLKMKDVISNQVTEEKIYAFLDKVAYHLKNKNKNKVTKSEYHLTKTHIGNDFRVSIRKFTSDIHVSIDTNTETEEVIILHQVKCGNPITIATLYGINSEQCSNFCDQIKEEENKINEMLDDFLQI